jgi:tetratricopeptide (TPR) repeat protein
MKEARIIFSATLVACFLATTALLAQTKKEKKIQLEGPSTGMYDGSKSKVAMEAYSEGEGYSKNRDWKAAAKCYKKAIKADDKFVEAYDNLGVAYRNLGDFDNAKKCYLKSIELFPNGGMAHMNLGVVYGIEKKYDEAIAQLLRNRSAVYEAK